MKINILTLIGVLFVAFNTTAQDDKYGATEEDQIRCKEALSTYRIYRDQEEFDDAYIFWQKTCEVCPPTVTERLWSDGAKFLKKQIKKAKGTDRESMLVDSLLIVHDKRIEYFASTAKNPNNGCDILGRKATDLLRYRKDEYRTAYCWYGEAIDCLQDKSRATYISNYYQLMFNVYATSEKGAPRDSLKQKLLLDYLTLQKHCDTRLENAKSEKQTKGYISAKENLDKYIIKVADNCDALIGMLENLVGSDPDDLSRKEVALKFMNMRDCTESDFYIKIAEEVCELSPSPEGFYSLGMILTKKGEYKKALTFYEKAVESCEDCADEETYLLKSAQQAAYLKMGTKAKRYANKVLDLDPNNGLAIIVIGDVIAGSQKSCDDKMDGRSVYWLAVDYYSRAKAKDSSVAEKAQKKINTYKKQFPTAEQIFFLNLADGNSFSVPCWGESTKVRSRK